VSADNWAQCPRCTARATKQLEKRESEVQALYGTVSMEAFDEARKVLADAKAAFERRRPTFREDYRIDGAETGTVTVKYGGECRVCRLGLKFTTEHPIPDWNKP
jgi:hypothetical protein